MPLSPARSYGANRFQVLWAGLRDRLRGEHARANARMGYLRQPAGEGGKVVWIKAGGSQASVRLATELMGAIRQKRLDVRLALTFEEDYPEILEPRLRGMRRLGLGFGPCDLPGVVRRTLERLQPLGIIWVDTEPPVNLAREARARGVHTVAFNTAPFISAVEAAYPRDGAQVQAWETAGAAGYLAPAADPWSLFAEAQVDTTLRSLAGGGQDWALWWWQGPVADAEAFVAAWRASPLAARGVLFVSHEDGAAGTMPEPPLTLSRWDRQALAAGAVVFLDDPRWRPAVASGATGVHFEQAGREALWEVLAAGSALTGSRELLTAHPALNGIVSAMAGPGDVLECWQGYVESPMAARKHGDACRRLAWEERRRLQSVLDEFLQRVYDW